MTTINEYFEEVNLTMLDSRLSELDSEDIYYEDELLALQSYADYFLKHYVSKNDNTKIQQIMDICRKHGFIPNYQVSGPIVFNSREIQTFADGNIFTVEYKERESAVLLGLTGEMRGIALFSIINQKQMIKSYQVSKGGDYLAMVVCNLDGKDPHVVIWDVRNMEVVYHDDLDGCTIIQWINETTLSYFNENLISINLATEVSHEIQTSIHPTIFGYNPKKDEYLLSSTETFIIKSNGDTVLRSPLKFTETAIIHGVSGGFNILSGGIFYRLSDTVCDITDLQLDIRDPRHGPFNFEHILDYGIGPQIPSTRGYLRVGRNGEEVIFTGSSDNTTIAPPTSIIDSIIENSPLSSKRIEGNIRDALKTHRNVWAIFNGFVSFMQVVREKSGMMFVDVHKFNQPDFFTPISPVILQSDAIEVPELSDDEGKRYYSNLIDDCMVREIDESYHISGLEFIDFHLLLQLSLDYFIIGNTDKKALIISFQGRLICINNNNVIKIVEGYAFRPSFNRINRFAIIKREGTYTQMDADLNLSKVCFEDCDICDICGNSVLTKKERVFSVLYKGRSIELDIPDGKIPNFIDEQTIFYVDNVMSDKTNGPGYVYNNYINSIDLETMKTGRRMVNIGKYRIVGRCDNIVAMMNIDDPDDPKAASISTFNLDDGVLKNWEGMNIPITIEDPQDVQFAQVSISLGIKRFILFSESGKNGVYIKRYNITKNGLKSTGNALFLNTRRLGSIMTPIDERHYVISNTGSDNDTTDETRDDVASDKYQWRTGHRPEHRIMDSLTGKTMQAGNQQVMQGLPGLYVDSFSRSLLMDDDRILVFQYGGDRINSWDLETGKRLPRNDKLIEGHLLGKFDEHHIMVVAWDRAEKCYRFKVYSDDLETFQQIQTDIADPNLEMNTDIQTFNFRDSFEIDNVLYSRTNCIDGQFGGICHQLQSEDVIIAATGDGYSIIPVRFGCYIPSLKKDFPFRETADNTAQSYVDEYVRAVSKGKTVAISVVTNGLSEKCSVDWKISTEIYTNGDKTMVFSDINSPFNYSNFCSPVFVSKDSFTLIREFKDGLNLELYTLGRLSKSFILPAEIQGMVPIFADEKCFVLRSVRDNSLMYSDWADLKNVDLGNYAYGLYKYHSDNDESVFFTEGSRQFELNKTKLTFRPNDPIENEVKLNSGRLVMRLGVCVLYIA